MRSYITHSFPLTHPPEPQYPEQLKVRCDVRSPHTPEHTPTTRRCDLRDSHPSYKPPVRVVQRAIFAEQKKEQQRHTNPIVSTPLASPTPTPVPVPVPEPLAKDAALLFLLCDRTRAYDPAADVVPAAAVPPLLANDAACLLGGPGIAAELAEPPAGANHLRMPREHAKRTIAAFGLWGYILVAPPRTFCSKPTVPTYVCMYFTRYNPHEVLSCVCREDDSHTGGCDFIFFLFRRSAKRTQGRVTTVGDIR